MAKKQSTTPVETLSVDQKQIASKFFLENATQTFKGAAKWAVIRGMFVVGGIIIDDIKAELAALNRQTWIDLKRKNKGEELTLEEIEQTKKTANSDFSRGVADPAVKTRKAQTTKDKKDADAKAVKEAQDKAKTGAGATEVKPSVVHAAEMLATRAKAISTELVAFQNHLTGANVRLPTQGEAMIGALSENVAKLNEEIGTMLALLA